MASLSPAARRVLENVDVALFDLDDTLVPVLAQLNKATSAAKAFMAVHMPQTNAVVEAKLRSTMKTYDRYPSPPLFCPLTGCVTHCVAELL